MSLCAFSFSYSGARKISITTTYLFTLIHCFNLVLQNSYIQYNNLTKQQHINYWVETAAKDWMAVDGLFSSKNYVQALFWAHLVLEKLLKAH